MTQQMSSPILVLADQAGEHLTPLARQAVTLAASLTSADVVALSLAAAPDGDGSAASAAPAQPVPMGVGSGIDRWISLISGELRLLAKGQSGSGPDAPTAGAVFDPATRSALAPDADPGLASARVGIETAVQSGNTGGSAVVRPGDGSAGIIMPIDDGSLARPSEMLDGGYRPAQQSRVTLESSNVAAMSVPGATLLIVVPSGHPIYSTPAPPIRIYAVPGGFP